MRTTTPPRPSITGAVAAHPWRSVARALPFGIAIMLGVDAVLGADAEYFNAWNLIGAWGRVLTGGAVDAGGPFIVNQESISGAVALAAGTAVLFLEPAIALTAVIWPVSRVLRRSRGAV